MKPILIIPTYVCGNIQQENTGVLNTYDHMTALDRPGELMRCLKSIQDLEEKAPIAILVVSEKGVEEEALDKIRLEASCFPDLDITVIGAPEEEALHGRMLQMGIGDFVHGIRLSGYGPSKNLGLVYAAAMGYTAAVFIDDDEIIDDPDFIEKSCYGLGMLTQNEIPILIKTGYYLDASGSYFAKDSHKWYNRFWRQHQGFNEWIDSAMHGPRLSSSNTAYGGCLALHREAFKRVSFDPWIPRGEDLDFLLNVRMYGSEVWFDNMWSLRHLPPPTAKAESRRFTQDIYRWMYEQRKLEFSTMQIDLLQVTPRSLYPYPGPFLESSVNFNITMTAVLRSIARAGQRRGYFKAAMSARKAAKDYAKENCSEYFSFQRRWPEVLALLEEDIALKGVFENAAVAPLTPEEIEELQLDMSRPDPYTAFRDGGAYEDVVFDVVEGDEEPRAVYADSDEEKAARRDGHAVSWDIEALEAEPPVEPPAREASETYAEPTALRVDDVVEAPRDEIPLDPQSRRDALKKSPFEDVLRQYEERTGDGGDE